MRQASRQNETRWVVGLGALGTCLIYYVLLWTGRAGVLQQSLPAFVGAWLPNATFALVSLALTAVTVRAQCSGPERPVGLQNE